MKRSIVLARQRIGLSFGGAEGYVSLLARAMRERGANVCLMAQEVDDGLVRDGFPVVRAESRWINIWNAYSFARAVQGYKRDHPETCVVAFDRVPDVDFIRAGDGCHRAYLSAMGQERMARVSFKHRVLLRLERQAYTSSRLKYIFSNSKMVAREIQELYDVPDDKIGVVHTGLPAAAAPLPTKSSARSGLGLASDSRVILFAGHNYERKGLDALIRALAQVKDARWTTLVAGKGDISKYRDLARRLGVEECVMFLGPRPLDDLFAAADVFVLPTRYDPLARVCVEAARAGLPVITTRRNGFSEWIEGDWGYVMSNETSVPDLAGILRRAFTADLESMGRRLKNRVAGLTIEKNADEMLKRIEA